MSAAPLLDGALRVTGFYEQALKSNDVGRELGFAPADTTYTLAAINSLAVVQSEQAEAVNNYFVHATPGTNNTLTAALSVAPSRHSYGALLSYEHYIPLFGGWYMGAQVPLVDSRTNLYLTQVNSDLHTPGELLNYFSGAYSSDTAGRKQGKVTKLRFDHYEHSTSNVVQLEVTLRKQLFANSRVSVDVRGEVTIPTSSPVDGSRLYQPTIGTNGHYQVGATATASALAWNGSKRCFGAELRAHAAYRFAREQSRTIPFSSGIEQQPLGHYALLTHTSAAAGDYLTPASEVLTQRCSVAPGMRVEGTSLLIYKHNDWQWLTGYTYAFAEAEAVTAPAWSDQGYAFAGPAYNTALSFAAQSSTSNVVQPIKTSDGSTHDHIIVTDLAPSLAGAPRMHSHTLWIQGSYAFKLALVTCKLNLGAACTVDGSAQVGIPVSAWGGLSLKV